MPDRVFEMLQLEQIVRVRNLGMLPVVPPSPAASNRSSGVYRPYLIRATATTALSWLACHLGKPDAGSTVEVARIISKTDIIERPWNCGTYATLLRWRTRVEYPEPPLKGLDGAG